MSKKYKAVIFDLDGVICSTDQFHYEAWKSITDELSIYFDEEINNRLRGVSRMESLDIILESYPQYLSAEEKQVLAERKNGRYRTSLANMSDKDLSTEVKTTLEELRRRGYLLAIGSSSRNAIYILERIGLGTYFDAICDGTQITMSKPSPEVFVKAASFMNMKPQECLVVEDAYAGIDAAISGQFDCAGIGEASQYEKTTYPIDKFIDLLKIL